MSPCGAQGGNLQLFWRCAVVACCSALAIVKPAACLCLAVYMLEKICSRLDWRSRQTMRESSPRDGPKVALFRQYLHCRWLAVERGALAGFWHTCLMQDALKEPASLH